MINFLWYLEEGEGGVKSGPRARNESFSRCYSIIKGVTEKSEILSFLSNSLLVSQLTRLNLASQQTERELRDELAESVPLKVSEAERKKIANYEVELVKNKVSGEKGEEESWLGNCVLFSTNILETVKSQTY